MQIPQQTRRLHAHVDMNLFNAVENLRHERSIATGSRIPLRLLVQEALETYVTSRVGTAAQGEGR